MKSVYKSLIFSGVLLINCYFIFDSIQHIRAEIHHRDGFLKSEKGYQKLAIHDFEQAVRLMPWETHYRLQLAKAYEKFANKNKNTKIENINKAINEYKKLIQLDSQNPWFYARLGLIYNNIYKEDKTKTKYKELAKKYSKKASMIDNKNPLFTLHYAHLLLNFKDIDNAIKYYEKSIEYDSDLIEAHFNLGNIYNTLNQKEKSLEKYETVCDLLVGLEEKNKRKPTKENIRHIKTFQTARIYVATDLLKKNKPNEAKILISKLPQSIEKYELLSIFFELTKQYENANKVNQVLKNQYENIKSNAIENENTEILNTVNKKLDSINQKLNI